MKPHSMSAEMSPVPVWSSAGPSWVLLRRKMNPERPGRSMVVPNFPPPVMVSYFLMIGKPLPPSLSITTVPDGVSRSMVRMPTLGETSP
jgi:hypothetical protein